MNTHSVRAKKYFRCENCKGKHNVFSFDNGETWMHDKYVNRIYPEHISTKLCTICFCDKPKPLKEVRA